MESLKWFLRVRGNTSASIDESGALIDGENYFTGCEDKAYQIAKDRAERYIAITGNTLQRFYCTCRGEMTIAFDERAIKYG